MPDAITPYNFVPQSSQVEPAELHVWEIETDSNNLPKMPYPTGDRYHSSLNTGWFDIELTALTPVFTRAAKKPEEFDKEQPVGFFQRADGKYALPGSGVRGMIRSVFEIITKSSLDNVANNQLFYRSFADIKGNLRDLYDQQFDPNGLVAGQIYEQNGEWTLLVSNQSTSHTNPTEKRGFVLLPVDDHNLKQVRDAVGELHVALCDSSGAWKRAAPLYDAFEYRLELLPKPDASLFKNKGPLRIKYCTVTSEPGISGWVTVPGNVIRPRHNWHVVLKPDPTTATPHKIDRKVVEDYLSWGEMAHGKRFGIKGHSPRRLTDGSPAFALLDSSGNICAIGANMMMSLRYEHSISQVSERPMKLPLPDLDMTQALFGRVREGNTGSVTNQIRGRLFFEDAICTDKARAEPHLAVTHKVILMGPKPTSFQVYLKQRDGQPLKHWDTDDAEIAGRKMYWHRSSEAVEAALQAQLPKDQERLASSLQPLPRGAKFAGRVRFENLTDAELGGLYASIHLPDGLAHKFGMGKSIGLGSVQVSISEVTLIDHKKRYASLAVDAGYVRGAEVQSRLAQCYSSLVARVMPRATTLWADGRMTALAAMLSWTGKPDALDTEQVGLNEQWTDRWTLKKPHQLATPDAVADVLPVHKSISAAITTDDSGVSKIDDETRHRNASTDSGTARRIPIGTNVPPADAVKYSIRQKVNCRVIAAKPSSEAEVELPNGERAIAEQAHYFVIGETYKFKVIELHKDGRVKRLRKA